MRVFVTGASGFIGSAVLPELIGAGHEVVGLARSDAAADAVAAAGARVQRGSLDDLDSLRAGAAASGGVIHLAYNHDFSDMQGAARSDLAAIEALGAELEGSGRPLLVAAGTLGLAAPGRLGTETDVPPAGIHPRTANTDAALAFAARGVRAVAVRFAPTVHGEGDRGFVSVLVGIARATGAAGYGGDGTNRWAGVHRLEAANRLRRAVEQAPPGSILHAVDDEGVPARDIAAALGRHLDLPVVSVAPEDAGAHFGWMARFFGTDAAASSALTRELLGWRPVHPGLIEDLDKGHYFA